MRVPIITPPVGVSPMVVSTGWPRWTVARLAPLPRWAMTARPSREAPTYETMWFIREPVEPIPADALFPRPLGQGVALRHLGHAPVEGGVEAHHLRNLGPPRGHQIDAGDLGRQVQWGEGHQRPQVGQHAIANQHGLGVMGPPWTTRWPTASGWGSECLSSASRTAPRAPAWLAAEVAGSSTTTTPSPPVSRKRPPSAPMRSTPPPATRTRSSRYSATLSDEDSAWTHRTAARPSAAEDVYKLCTRKSDSTWSKTSSTESPTSAPAAPTCVNTPPTNWFRTATLRPWPVRPSAMRTYEQLSDTRRKEYARWVGEAKKAETRAAHTAKAVVMLAQGVRTPG